VTAFVNKIPFMHVDALSLSCSCNGNVNDHGSVKKSPSVPPCEQRMLRPDQDTKEAGYSYVGTLRRSCQTAAETHSSL